MKAGQKILSLFVVAAVLLQLNCAVNRVAVLDYQARSGEGSEVYYNGRVVNVGAVAPQRGKTAVVFKDHNGNYVTNHSNENTVNLYHWEVGKTEMVRPVPAGNLSLVVKRFYLAGNDAQLLVGLIMIGTVGLIPIGIPVALTSFEASNHINVYEENGVLRGYGKLSNYFIEGKKISLVLDVVNNGTLTCMNEFVLADVIPGFFDIQSVEWWGNAEKVTYDIHVRGNKQILAVKVTPDKKYGMRPEPNGVRVFVTMKPDIKKFKTKTYAVDKK